MPDREQRRAGVNFLARMFEMDAGFVAIDLETTGLDPASDRITEVAAVRYDAFGQAVDTFSSLVNPGRPIPPFVTRLTGITDADVAGAPCLEVVLPELLAFAGASAVVGQNVGFDLAFLRQAGVLLPGESADTAAMARVLLPALKSHGLEEVGSALGLDAGDAAAGGPAHRALPDARMAGAVFLGLRARLDAMPGAQRRQLGRLLQVTEPELGRLVLGGLAAAEGEALLPQLRPAPDWPALQKVDPRRLTGPSPLARAFAAARETFPAFEERPEQREMAETIRGALNDGGHWLIEAGTGTGKSLAYLIPAALHALNNGERVVVSTNTINLQEQLLTKDVPALRRLLVQAGTITAEGDLRVSVLKGRNNYLCMRRFTAHYASGLGDPDFARLATALLLWLPETETGDRSELNLDSASWTTWQRFSAQDADCLARPNIVVREGNCFLQRARKAAESAHILIVNHSLLLADLASGGSAIPPYDHLIVDEAHNLEDQATQQFGGLVSRRRLGEAVDGLHRPAGREVREGGVAGLLTSLPEGLLSSAGEQLKSAVARAGRLIAPCFEALDGLLPRGEDDRLLVTSGMRNSEGWTALETAWAPLDAALGAAQAVAQEAANLVRSTRLVDEADVLAAEVESAARKLGEPRELLRRLVNSADAATIVWLARERDGSAAIACAPLDIGPTLWEHLFAPRRTVIATSATLAARGTTDYAARRLGLEQPRSLILGSPFDYERATLLTTASDLPEPGAPGYLEALAAGVAELARAAGGRTLALFTSHAALQATATRLRPLLERDGIAVLGQGVDGSPRQLTEQLLQHPRTVVLGTNAFWEGVDIRGEALSLLIVARLPFAVPTDPIYQARAGQFDDSFGDFALPQAILRFRQGFGRLIRDQADCGVVAVLDRRIFEKRYGADFVRALPKCTTLKAPVATIAAHIREWLAP